MPSISSTAKDDIVNPKTKNIRLYVKRVFISDDFDGELVNLMARFFILPMKERMHDLKIIIFWFE